MANLNVDGNTEVLAAALQDAAGDLEGIGQTHHSLVEEFETYGWTGLDALEGAQSHITSVTDSLITVADKIGIGGQIVRDALLSNHMITNATKESLGHG
ncbi:hypothetical protein [Pseudonocardia parietis]|uniref:WXG100 family type VII secretion target n=1 Tax=Pseudonocardia parietis TaxID=570936 RepID=A0ABS4W568_9PSEU|nr:hypothetical protein [Pseudonocardia parietis]MBP2371354.1 hypothetical protein [Pseudonocardia parietis]